MLLGTNMLTILIILYCIQVFHVVFLLYLDGKYPLTAEYKTKSEVLTDLIPFLLYIKGLIKIIKNIFKGVKQLD